MVGPMFCKPCHVVRVLVVLRAREKDCKVEHLVELCVGVKEGLRVLCLGMREARCRVLDEDVMHGLGFSC